MARYIDAESMKRDLLTVDPQFETMIHWCITVLDAQPTADVRENVRGEWIYGEEGCYGNPYGHYSCSNCNEQMPWRFDFCPNCGADMRGDHG